MTPSINWAGRIMALDDLTPRWMTGQPDLADCSRLEETFVGACIRGGVGRRVLSVETSLQGSPEAHSWTEHLSRRWHGCFGHD